LSTLHTPIYLNHVATDGQIASAILHLAAAHVRHGNVCGHVWLPINTPTNFTTNLKTLQCYLHQMLQPAWCRGRAQMQFSQVTYLCDWKVTMSMKENQGLTAQPHQPMQHGQVIPTLLRQLRPVTDVKQPPPVYH